MPREIHYDTPSACQLVFRYKDERNQPVVEVLVLGVSFVKYDASMGAAGAIGMNVRLDGTVIRADKFTAEQVAEFDAAVAKATQQPPADGRKAIRVRMV